MATFKNILQKILLGAMGIGAALTGSGYAGVSTLDSSSGNGPNYAHGMEFINNTPNTLYFVTTYISPYNSPTCLPTPVSNGITFTVQSGQNNNGNYLCSVEAEVPGTQNGKAPLYVTQKQILPVLAWHETPIQICSSQPIYNNGTYSCQDDSSALCTSHVYTTSLDPITNLTQFVKYASVQLQDADATNDSYSITLQNTPVQNACILNIDLSSILQQITPQSPPQRLSIANKVYNTNSPILTMSSFFLDSAPTPSQKYWVAVTDSKNPNNNNPTALTPMVTDGVFIPGNPMNLQYGDPKNNGEYTDFLMTGTQGLAYGGISTTCPSGICQINMCSCDTTLTNDPSKGPGVFDAGGGGICPANTNNYLCAAPAGVTCAPGNNTWASPNNGMVGACFDLQLIKGVYPYTPTQLMINNETQQAANQPLAYFTTGLPRKGGWINLSSFFGSTSTTNTPQSATYSIATSSTLVSDRANGDNPSYPLTGEGANAGWEPMIIQEGIPGIAIPDTAIPQVFMTELAPTSTPPTTSVNVAKNYWLYVNGNAIPGNPKNAVIQFTVASTLGSSTAYQTLYVNLSDENTTLSPGVPSGSLSPTYNPSYTPLADSVSAWIYGPDEATALINEDPNTGYSQCNQTVIQNPTPAAQCTTSSPDYPNCKYVPIIAQNGITSITPDIGWVEFGTASSYLKSWNDNVGPLDNNIYSGYTNSPNGPVTGTVSGSMIDCIAQYYHNAMKKLYNKDIQFVTTFEFDAPLKGQLPSLTSGEVNGTFSQIARLTANVGAPIYNDPNIQGIQFDVEPLPTQEQSLVFFKNIADLLARAGKINELFGFADADSPKVIMAQGPLGIMMPSTYDVPQHTDRSYQSAYNDVYGNPSSFTSTQLSNPANLCQYYPWAISSACVVGNLDYACHYNPTGKDPLYFEQKSWCSVNVNNMLRANASGFGMSDSRNPGNTNAKFAANNAYFGGHFQMAVPSEGSATAWQYEIIHVPTIENGSSGSTNGCSPNNAPSDKPCVLPTVPSNYTPIYIPLSTPTADPVYISDSELRAATLAYSNPKCTGPTGSNNQPQCVYPPNPNSKSYYLYYVPPKTPTAANLPACLAQAPDTADQPWQTGIPACLAAVVSGGPDTEQDPSAQAVITGGVDPNTPWSPDYFTQYQAVFTQAMIDLATNGLSTRYSPNSSYLIGQPISSHASDSNPNNLGLALYAIAAPPVYGCQPGGNHYSSPNCLEEYPMSTNDTVYSSTGTQYPNQVWNVVSNYMGSDVPPPPVYPVRFSSLLVNALKGSSTVLGAVVTGLVNGNTLQFTVPGATPQTINYNPFQKGAPATFTGLTTGQSYQITVVALNASKQAISAPYAGTFTEYANYPITYGPITLLKHNGSWYFVGRIYGTIPAGTTFYFSATAVGSSSPICSATYPGNGAPICSATLTPGNYNISVSAISGNQLSSATQVTPFTLQSNTTPDALSSNDTSIQGLVFVGNSHAS